MEHVADRPSWNCAACGKPWPCQPAREELRALTPTRLAVLMWGHLEDAAGDLPTMSAGAMFDRFLYWTRAVRPRRR